MSGGSFCFYCVSRHLRQRFAFLRRVTAAEIRKNATTAAMAASVRVRYSVVFAPSVLTDSHRSFIVCVASMPSSSNASLRSSTLGSG